jgi:hypothetical protein
VVPANIDTSSQDAEYAAWLGWHPESLPDKRDAHCHGFDAGRRFAEQRHVEQQARTLEAASEMEQRAHAAELEQFKLRATLAEIWQRYTKQLHVEQQATPPGALPQRWGTDTPVFVPRCPEHGLQGQRDDCFECGGRVEQIPLVSADWLDRCEHNVKRARDAEQEQAKLREALEFYAGGIGFSEREDDGAVARAALAAISGGR